MKLIEFQRERLRRALAESCHVASSLAQALETEREPELSQADSQVVSRCLAAARYHAGEVEALMKEALNVPPHKRIKTARAEREG